MASENYKMKKMNVLKSLPEHSTEDIDMYNQNEKNWYPLDVSAKVYPSLESVGSPNVFRLSMQLKEEIDKDLLKQALDNIKDRFPYFQVSLHKGVFWHYLQSNNQSSIIWPDSPSPCERLHPALNNGYLYRVKYYQNNIAVEFFHVITDGTGGMEFLKCLVHQYLYLAGKVKKNLQGIINIYEKASKEEGEDAFLTAYNSIEKKKEAKQDKMLFSQSKSYQFNDRILPAGEVEVITGAVSVSDLKEICAKYDATITQLLVSLYIEAAALMQIKQVKNSRYHKNIAIEVPVNLRKYHKIKCMRNFAMFVIPTVNPREINSFNYIVDEVKKYMNESLTQENIDKMIVDNCDLATNKAVANMPIAIKNLVVNYINNTMSTSQFTSVISNVGLVKLPNEMKEHVKNINFILGPSHNKKRSCAAVGYNGKLYVTFSRNAKDTYIERRVFRRLVELGAKVSITSNKGEI